MRFDVKDLLMLTAVVALYASGLALAPILEFQRIDLIWLVVPLAHVPNVVKAWRSRRAVGARVAEWRDPRMWWFHIGFAALFVGFCLCFKSVGMPGKPFALGVVLPNHLLFWTMSQVTLGENGVVVGPTILRRSHYAFRLEPSRRRLNYRLLPGAPLPWYQQSSGRMPVPERHFEAVQRWVESPTPPADEAT